MRADFFLGRFRAHESGKRPRAVAARALRRDADVQLYLSYGVHELLRFSRIGQPWIGARVAGAEKWPDRRSYLGSWARVRTVGFGYGCRVR